MWWTTLGFCEKKRREKRICTSFFLGDCVLGNGFHPTWSSDCLGESYNAFHNGHGMRKHAQCICVYGFHVGVAGIGCLVLQMFSFPTPNFSLFPTDVQWDRAWSSMRPVHFYPIFPPWHIMIRCLKSDFKALGTQISWLGHVHSTEVHSMVLRTNVSTHTFLWCRFDLASLFFVCLCSDWPTWWCYMIWDRWI